MAAIEVPGVDFGAIAREVIAVKLTEALATSPAGVTSIVHAALGVKVNAENGNPPRYSYDPTVSWVEWVAADMIRNATKKVLADHVESMRPVLEKAVEKELRSASKTIAQALVQTYAAEKAKNGYRLNVALTFKSEQK